MTIRNQPMVAFPKMPPPKLSSALQTHRAYIGTYSKYAPVKRIACDECLNVLHEAGGTGQPPPRRKAFASHTHGPAATMHAPCRTVARDRRHRKEAAMKRQQAAAGWDSRTPDGIRVETGVPGHPVDVVQRGDGVIEERNGAGSVVAWVYPYGIEGVSVWGPRTYDH